MDTDADAFLHDLDALDLTSPTSIDRPVVDGIHENVKRGKDAVFGKAAGSVGTAIPTQFSNFDFDVVHHPHTMDLASFNVFDDKHNDGRRDDNAAMPPPSAQRNANNVNFDALQQLLSMQMPYPMSLPAAINDAQAQNHSGSSSNSNAAVLFEQQLRLQQLQQLQQLQNQIFQQQIELISAQSSVSNSLESTPLPNSAFRDASQFQGLPTPANSTELRPQPPSNLMSPMDLQNYLAQPGPSGQFGTQNTLPHGSSSAPAHLAFSTHAPLLSPGDLDFELSPLTSPWLGAASYQQAQQQLQQRQPQQSQQSQAHIQTQTQTQTETKRRASKRGASSSGDDAEGHAQTRKRQSPAIRATPGAPRKAQARSRGSVSVSSTPAMHPQSSRSSVPTDVVGDTPSPVDLSMAPPAPQASSDNSSSSTTRVVTSVSSGSSTQGSALSPVTPASIMNLGRLGLSSGLSSPRNSTEDQQQARLENNNRSKGKTKAPPKALSTSGKSISKKGSSTSLVSPSLKPLLPGGLTASSVAQLGAVSNYTHQVSGSAAALHIAPATPLPPPAPAVRKTSHKAAEQKRRDSLKSSFDALRSLLPPLPLPNDENYQGEAPLPGAMPPRGPPRGDVSGPNRAASKLQLLRCGNDFIRMLKARITRRDEYIEQLKREVRVLRAKVEAVNMDDVTAASTNIDAIVADIEKVDLEKDIDAEEENAPRLGLGGPPMEADEEADEECD